MIPEPLFVTVLLDVDVYTKPGGADEDRKKDANGKFLALSAPALEEDIGGVRGVQTRRPRIERGLQVGHRGQWIVVDLDERGPVGGGVGRARGHHRHRFAASGATRPSRSRPVSTSSTPAAARAAVVSTARTAAWACGLRAKAACRRPGSGMSSR